MAQEKFAVRLTVEDRSELERLIRSGRSSARVINRARILLKTDEGWSASQVTSALDTSPRTVFRTKRRYAEEGLDGVLHDRPQANRYRSLDDRGEAHLIALACSGAPEGPRPPSRSGQPGHGRGRLRRGRDQGGSRPAAPRRRGVASLPAYPCLRPAGTPAGGLRIAVNLGHGRVSGGGLAGAT